MSDELLLRSPSEALKRGYNIGYEWDGMDLRGVPSYEITNAWESIDTVNKVTSADGSITLGWDYPHALTRVDSNDATQIVSGVSSNSLPATYTGENASQVMIPAYSGGGGGGGADYTVRSGAFDGDGNLVAVVADKVKLGVAGVSLGTKLGLKFDESLYSTDPAWWDAHYPSVNPETWGQLATIDGPVGSIAGFALRTFFGIDTDGNSAQYLSADALAYTYMMLRDMGAFDEGDTDYTYNNTVKSQLYKPDFNYNVHTGPTISYTQRFSGNRLNSYSIYPADNAGKMFCVPSTTQGVYSIIVVSKTPTYFINKNVEWNGNIYSYNTPVATALTKNGVTYYYNSTSSSFDSRYVETIITSITPTNYPANTQMTQWVWDIAHIIFNGTGSASTNVPGCTTQSAATKPDRNIVNGTTVPQVKQQLMDNYPDLFDGSITTKTLQDDGTITEDEYIKIPKIEDTVEPTTGDKTQDAVEITPQEMDEQITKTPIDDPPDTGSGSGPAVVAPTGSASSLWAVYNPSQSQLNSFGSWLWSSDFVDQLKKLFVDPMQAIIGVHKVYAPVPTSGSATIKCGYLDSNVSAAVVSSQYTEVDCGSVYCGEYYGNVFDYEPYTKISIYLPFIGVVQLKPSEVMRSNVHVSYGVDVITGACLAKVKITRDGGGAILYSYGGSCACHYPISSGSYSGIISGIVTAATGIAAGIATASPLAAVGGVLAGARQAHADVQHSGGFTGCSGVMGPKKPYLIIVRPQPKTAQNYEDFQGKPSNTTTYLSECDGFVTVKEAHIIAPHAYENELQEINALLKDGVIINPQYPISN